MIWFNYMDHKSEILKGRGCSGAEPAADFIGTAPVENGFALGGLGLRGLGV